MRSHEREPVDRLGIGAWLTCQARVPRSSALAWTSPAVASSAAATDAVGGRRAARRTRCLARRASATTSGVGREVRVRTVSVNPESSPARPMISSSPRVTPSPRRTCSAGRVDVAADHQDAVLGPGLGALDHVGRDAGVLVVRQRLVGPGEPPAHADQRHRGRDHQRRPPPCRARRGPRPTESRRWPAITAAVTKQACSTTTRNATPAWDVGRRQGDGDVAEQRARALRPPRRSPSRRAPGSGSRSAPGPPARGPASTMPTHHGAPSPPIRPASRSRVSTLGVGSRPMSRISALARAVEDRRAATRARAAPGTTPTAVAGGPQIERSAIAPGTIRDAAASTTRPSARPNSQATGAERRDQREQQAGPPGGPPPPVGVRVGEPERGMGEPGQQGPGHHRAEPSVAPGSGRDRHQRVRRRPPQQQPARRALRADQPADHPEEPPGPPQRRAVRRGRAAPRPTRWSRAARRAPRAGRCTAAPGRRCRARGDARTRGAGATSRPPTSGTGDSPPPVTSPNPARAATSASSTNPASSTAIGLVRNRAARPVSTYSSSSSSAVCRRAAIDDGSCSAAATRRRSATSAAWLVAAAARSLTKSSPCR